MGKSAHCSRVNHQKNNNLLYGRYCIKWSHVIIFVGCLGLDLGILQCNAAQRRRALNASRVVGWGEEVELAGAFVPVPFSPMLVQSPGQHLHLVRDFAQITHPMALCLHGVL